MHESQLYTNYCLTEMVRTLTISEHTHVPKFAITGQLHKTSKIPTQEEDNCYKVATASLWKFRSLSILCLPLQEEDRCLSRFLAVTKPSPQR